jgi:hypothetical protein
MQNAVWLLAAMDILGSPGVLLSQLLGSITDLVGAPLRHAARAVTLLAAPLTTGNPSALLARGSAGAAARDVLLPRRVSLHETRERALRATGAIVSTTYRSLMHAVHGVAQASYRVNSSLYQCAASICCI